MKLQGLTIAALVLAVLSATLYWSNHHKASSAALTTSSDATPPAPKILTLKDDDIAGIELAKNGQEQATLGKDANGKWQITGPKPLAADQTEVSSLVSTLASLSSDRLVADKVDDLRQYGLAPPSLELTVTTKDHKSRKLLLGDDTPASSGAFAMLEGDPRVFTIASYTKTSINKGLNDLRDKRLMTLDMDKISQLELITQKEHLAFGRNKQEWQILKPQPLRADNYQVDELVRKLGDAKMDLSGSDTDQKKAASGFASGSALATVKVVGPAGLQELQVRKNKDNYYATSSVVAGIYKVSSDLGQALDKHLNDFRNKKLFDFGFDEPNKVEVHDGAKAYFFTKGGQDWWADGKKMDASSVQALIDKLRELSASKFVDSGFAKPMLDLMVTSNEGKRVEKVQVSKSGDKYIAKRENEPGLCEMDSSAVSQLQKAADNVKAAPPAAPAVKK